MPGRWIKLSLSDRLKPVVQRAAIETRCVATAADRHRRRLRSVERKPGRQQSGGVRIVLCRCLVERRGTTGVALHVQRLKSLSAPAARRILAARSAAAARSPSSGCLRWRALPGRRLRLLRGLSGGLTRRPVARGGISRRRRRGRCRNRFAARSQCELEIDRRVARRRAKRQFALGLAERREIGRHVVCGIGREENRVLAVDVSGRRRLECVADVHYHRRSRQGTAAARHAPLDPAPGDCRGLRARDRLLRTGDHGGIERRPENRATQPPCDLLPSAIRSSVHRNVRLLDRGSRGFDKSVTTVEAADHPSLGLKAIATPFMQ